MVLHQPIGRTAGPGTLLQSHRLRQRSQQAAGASNRRPLGKYKPRGARSLAGRRAKGYGKLAAALS
jgi:hypothetical protein